LGREAVDTLVHLGGEKRAAHHPLQAVSVFPAFAAIAFMPPSAPLSAEPV
jgi:hypothetical protein